MNADPHGLYILQAFGQEIRFIHNYSIRQKFTLEIIENISVSVENAYLLFPTRVSVKLFTIDNRPSINSLVTTEYDGMEYSGFTDNTGKVSFYLPRSLSMCSNVTVSTSGITNETKICRDPAPIAILALMMSNISFYISKS